MHLSPQGWCLDERCGTCAELHEKQAELWDAFSKEARSNKTLVPYWELLAMYDAPAEEGDAGRGAQKGSDADAAESNNSTEEEGLTAEEQPQAAPVQEL